MIPKIIHYCWFGNNPLPKSAQKCIASWKKYCPDYEIKEWNETNYNVHKIAYIDKAHNAKKYAFVSDYARFDILYQYGGVYFDIDVEVIKSFDDILNDSGFMGLETLGNVNAGLGMGCNARLEIIQQILHLYEDLNFLNPDKSYNTKTVVEYVTTILKKYGLKDEDSIQYIEGLTIYPIEYFSPKNWQTGKIIITQNTYSIHHYDASWLAKPERFYMIIRDKSIKIFGYTLGRTLIMPISIIKIFISEGLIGIKERLIKRFSKLS